jgi:hypothetical protein
MHVFQPITTPSPPVTLASSDLVHTRAGAAPARPRSAPHFLQLLPPWNSAIRPVAAPARALGCLGVQTPGEPLMTSFS